jgi:hypothetical protein
MSGAPRQASNAAWPRRKYRGWSYIVYRVSRFGWDVDYEAPGELIGSDFFMSPFAAITERRADQKFRSYVDSNIAGRVESVARQRALHGPDVLILPGDEPTAEEVGDEL